jgi:hypothetical protein
MLRACSTHEEERNAYRVLVGKLEGKRPLWRPRLRWEDDIKLDLNEREDGIVCTGFVWLRIGNSGELLWTRLHKVLGHSLVAEHLAAFQEGQISVKLASSITLCKRQFGLFSIFLKELHRPVCQVVYLAEREARRPGPSARDRGSEVLVCQYLINLYGGNFVPLLTVS